jgi:hypothetical protein
MRIAIDVKGTIEGPKKKAILSILHMLQALGHEVIVWSNMYSYATDAIRDNKLTCEASPKRDKGDYDHDESQYFDIAIDDDTKQDYLAAKHFIWVKDIPEDAPQSYVRGVLKKLSEGN